MIKNMSTLDRIFRIILAAAVIILYVTNVITGTLGAALIAIAVVFLATSFISYCPLYTVLGIKRWERSTTADRKK